MDAGQKQTENIKNEHALLTSTPHPSILITVAHTHLIVLLYNTTERKIGKL
jgi:hypothetical protein